MTERSPKANPGPLSSNTTLKPVLQSVLESLDVQLESELTRYRRQKRGESVQPSYSGNGLAAAQKTAVDLISLNPSPSNAVQSAASSELPYAQTLKFEALQPMAAAEGTTTDATLTPETANGNQSLPVAIPAIATSGDPRGTQNGASLSTEAPGALTGPTPGTDATAPPNPTDPNTYLDSSEKLVNSLDRDNGKKLAELRARRKSRSQNSFLSPLGIGSLLLFVAASATLVYVATQMGDSPEATPQTQANPGGNTTGLVPEPPSVNDAPRITPDLTNSEFKPLDLGNLGTLEDKPSVAVPAPTPQGAVPETPGAIAPSVTANSAPETPPAASPGLSNLTTDYLAGSGQPTATPPATGTPPTATANPGSGTTTPTPANATPATPAPTSGVSPASFPGFYYVVMDYQNDQSLTKAREVVPDAYLREYPIGVKIQVAAFEDEASAKVMVEQMKGQGINAQIYRP
jgi:hypothetical protein